MPIKIPNDLPAAEKLRAEGVMVIGEDEALRQDIRPMQIALLNLMPDKPKTETQLARLLGATPLQVELTLLTTSTYRPNTVPLSHLQAFYTTWEEVRHRKFDGLIVTGAPVELLPFEEVKYWPELCAIFDWSRTHCHSSFFICWGAQAALYHFHKVPKHTLPTKRFGIYTHYVIETRDAR
ncbi:MAG: homoserine O-succinyltransferase, partial [Geminicoccaceae bacterium]|nr:homoserine O-succinyltransferase [Geminicoccaceae bacterium]